MTYFGFLLLFLALPLLALGLQTWFEAHHGEHLLVGRTGRVAAAALLVHVTLALAYTTPWDNYLVATRVWWYNPARVLGLTLGWVPLEEYLFFVLQTLLAGLLLFALARRLPPGAFTRAGPGRVASVCTVAGLWLASVLILALGWKPGTYLGLELAWALPPIGLQLAAGADILWRHRRSVFATLVALTLYLGLADSTAIGAGVWTIDPAQSLNLLVARVLPIEEVIFFLLTNVVVIFGLTLALAPETWERWERFKALLRRSRLLPENI